jgi:glycosyltransferase involved in cell wall biosynthesis
VRSVEGKAGQIQQEANASGAGSASKGYSEVWTGVRGLPLFPYRIVRAVFQRTVSYDKRLIFWSWRRRKTFQLRMFAAYFNVSRVRALRAELKAILAQYPDAKGVVIFPPSVPWYTELFQRPHQMALAFAAEGYVVLYWVEDMDGDFTTPFRKIGERLHLCNVPPTVLRICQRPIFISYTYNYHWATLLRSPVVVYELIDHLDIFSNFPRRMLERYHRRLLKRAELVVGTADDLVAELKPLRPDAILCPNGVDLAHFAPVDGDESTADAVPADLRPIVARGQPVIGYYGAMAEWFDFDLVKHAAAALPDYQFVLIGPDYDGLTMRRAGISAYPNIHWLGPKRYAELPRYLANFDVATIPFRVTEALQAVSPIKLFEYMAGGKPIVTTDLVECRKYPVVLIARNPDEWVARLREAVARGQDAAYLAEVRRTAEQNTWRSRAQVELQALAAHRRHGDMVRRIAGAVSSR